MSVELLMPGWRYTELSMHGPGLLTEAEVFAGWHFCPTFSGKLVGPTMRWFTECRCAGIDNGVTAHD